MLVLTTQKLIQIPSASQVKFVPIQVIELPMPSYTLVPEISCPIASGMAIKPIRWTSAGAYTLPLLSKDM